MEKITIFSPFIGFLLAGLGGKYFGDRFAQGITCLLMGISTLLSILIFHKVALQHQEEIISLLPWIQVDTFTLEWGLRFDTLSAVMVLVVCLVSFAVHIYSIGYMRQDHSIPRFMAYLSFFTFSMLVLVTAPNLVQLFFGWEGVGLASYLLIGFWYERPTANAAAIKAFIVNRIGDVGLALGICAIFLVFESVNFDVIFSTLPKIMGQDYNTLAGGGPTLPFFGYNLNAMNVICFLLFWGAMGKSAQLGLHTWLPDAMEGPTPVSALIHAATMVTAGVFLVVRLSPLFEQAPLVQTVICIIGVLTALFAASIALVQNDIKRIIAYSTCSQLGYMFFAVGVSAYGAAIFHLVTHAFFKALLFLGAGSIIHAMSDEQDLRRMGGIYRLIPITYGCMWIGSLALSGIPFFAGYYSKDAILELVYVSNSKVAIPVFIIGLIVVVMTAFYSLRLMLLVFHGKPRADDRVMAHVHKAPLSMKIPLIMLAVGAVVSGYMAYDLFIHQAQSFWGKSIVVIPAHDPLHNLYSVPWWVKISPTVCAIIGIFLAYVVYSWRPTWSEIATQKLRRLYTLLLNKWYIDELYDWLFVRTIFIMGRLFWKKGDGQLIDGLGPDGFASASLSTARLTSRMQTGYVYHYAFAMLIGIVILTSWYLFMTFGIHS